MQWDNAKCWSRLGKIVVSWIRRSLYFICSSGGSGTVIAAPKQVNDCEEIFLAHRWSPNGFSMFRAFWDVQRATAGQSKRRMAQGNSGAGAKRDTDLILKGVFLWIFSTCAASVLHDACRVCVLLVCLHEDKERDVHMNAGST